MTSPLGPLRAAPIYKPKPWAGGLLSGFVPGLAEGTGEVWLVSDVEGDPSPLVGAPRPGMTLRELVAERPVELLGEALADGGRFPLLVKLLDIGAPLSVQLHPDAAMARELGDGERGKAEAWLVLARGEEGRVELGLAAPTAPAEVVRLAESGDLPGRLAGFRPALGEGIDIRPGTLHTARQVAVLEVQETSDVTYRVFDWGRGRDLHLAQARRCLEALDGAAPPRSGEGWRRGRRELRDGPPFSFEAVDLTGSEALTLPGGAPRVVVVLEGKLTLEAPGHPPQRIGRAEAFVLPACLPETRLQTRGWSRLGLAAPRA